jgi:hypothetical protein
MVWLVMFPRHFVPVSVFPGVLGIGTQLGGGCFLQHRFRAMLKSSLELCKI